MATPTTAPTPASTPLGPIVYFYADHKTARGMKSMDDTEPFVAIIASPRSDGSGFSVPVTAVTEPVPPAPAASAPVVSGGGVMAVGAIVGGQSYRNGIYKDVPLLGGSGKGARATITVAGNVVTAVVPSKTAPGAGYVVGDELSAALVDRLINVLVLDHAGRTFAFESVPLFQGDDGDDKAAPFHCEATYRKIEKPAPVVPAPDVPATSTDNTTITPVTPIMGAPPPVSHAPAL